MWLYKEKEKGRAQVTSIQVTSTQAETTMEECDIGHLTLEQNRVLKVKLTS